MRILIWVISVIFGASWWKLTDAHLDERLVVASRAVSVGSDDDLAAVALTLGVALGAALPAPSAADAGVTAADVARLARPLPQQRLLRRGVVVVAGAQRGGAETEATLGDDAVALRGRRCGSSSARIGNGRPFSGLY